MEFRSLNEYRQWCKETFSRENIRDSKWEENAFTVVSINDAEMSVYELRRHALNNGFCVEAVSEERENGTVTIQETPDYSET